MEAGTARTAIVCDTTSYLPAEMIEPLGINVVSLYVALEGRQEAEAEISDYSAFYDRLRASDEGATTSQPSVGDFVAAYQPLLAKEHATSTSRGVQVEGLQTRTEQVADGVARVQATAGRLAAGMPGETVDLSRATAKDQAPYVVTIQRDGTWYPSLVFTATDWILNRAERERP